MDITPIFDAELQQRGATPTANVALSLQHIDEFLKEAYKINAHIASLNTYLRDIRQSYLSLAQPPRRTTVRNQTGSQANEKQRFLTERQRDEIDAETKQLLRELNAGIRNLADAEDLRQKTEQRVRQQKYGRRGLGILSKWAAGGGESSKPFEQAQEEAATSAISAHRESVLWFLRQRLQECGSLQASMMETRITREVEKNKSVLYKTRGQMQLSGSDPVPAPVKQKPRRNVHMEDEDEQVEEQLSAEQLQMLEQDNQDMMKHYQDTLDQVKTAEKSLVEISELQTQLVNNLATQSAHIEQLVVDSDFTAENVGGGNKQLKKASERKSTAKYVFYASCGLSLTLVVWDLLI